MKPAAFFTLCATALTASAQSASLFVPVFESQPLTADVAGINTNGDTTYILRASNTGFAELSGTATLVQGSTGASFGILVQPTAISGNGFEVHYSCIFENDEASCTGLGFDDEVLDTVVPLSLTAVPIGSTLPGVATTTPSTAPTGSDNTVGSPQATNVANRATLGLYALALVIGSGLAVVA